MIGPQMPNGDTEVPAPTRAFRASISAAILALMVFAGSRVAMADRETCDFGPLDASRSLREFGGRSSWQILFASDKVRGFVTNAVLGAYEPLDAIHLMLNGTGLSVSEKTTGV